MIVNEDEYRFGLGDGESSDGKSRGGGEVTESNRIMGEHSGVDGKAGATEQPPCEEREDVELPNRGQHSVIQKVNITKLYHKTKAGYYDLN